MIVLLLIADCEDIGLDSVAEAPARMTSDGMVSLLLLSWICRGDG